MQALRKSGYSRRGPYRTRGSGLLRSRRSIRKPARYGGQGRYYRYGTRRLMRGMGAYVENAIVTSGMPGAHNPVPSFSHKTDGTISLSNKEYIGDIFAPVVAGAFQNTVYPVNPGMEKTFPWLCQLAENYDEYTLKQCIFTYKSSVADFASASGQVGQVIMATQYNAAAQPFTDKQNMMQYAFACSGKTSEDMLQGVECDPAKLSGPTGHFTRNGPIPITSGADINNYDHGALNVAVTDCPATYAGQQLGELWVSYTVELRKPKFVTANGWGIGRDVYVNQGNWWGTIPFGSNGLGAPYSRATMGQSLKGQANNLGTKLLTPSSATVAQGTDGWISTNPVAGGTVGTAAWYLQPGGVYISGGYVATDAISFALVFDPGYSGNIQIVLNVSGTVAQDTPICNVFLPSSSNIIAINDIYDTSSDSWCPLLRPALTPPATAGVSNKNQIIMHIRVTPNSYGTPNQIIFTTPGPYGVGPDRILNSYLDVAEYNTAFNYKQDGTADAIVLTNISGAIVPL